MPAKTTTKTRTTKPKATAARKQPAAKKAHKPVDRLDQAIAAAQDALKDLRGDLSRGRKALVKDVDTTLKDARGNLRRVRKTLVKDLDEVGHKLSGSSSATKRKPAPKRKPAAKRKTKASASKAKTSRTKK